MVGFGRKLLRSGARSVDCGGRPIEYSLQDHLAVAQLSAAVAHLLHSIVLCILNRDYLGFVLYLLKWCRLDGLCV